MRVAHGVRGTTAAKPSYPRCHNKSTRVAILLRPDADHEPDGLTDWDVPDEDMGGTRHMNSGPSACEMDTGAGVPVALAIVDRRNLLAGAGATAFLAAWLGRAGDVLAQERPASATAAPAAAQTGPGTFKEAMTAILGDAKPVPERILLDLPEIAENGNTVPFTLIVDSPMTDTDRVTAAHVVSSGNPQPSVASFYFGPLAGKASVTSRMRLAKSQDVIAVAELSSGQFLIATRAVKVTIGGCGG